MLFQNALNFLFSQKCLLCGKRNKDVVCDFCFNKLNRLSKCKVVNLKNKNLTSLIYFFKYEKIIRKLILQFKFFNKPYLAKVFAKIILKNEKICEKIKFYDIIISVPMYKEKKRARGYNQTELLASQIAKNLNMDYNKNLLIKVVNTKMQSKLSEKDRYQNIENAFEIADIKKVHNKKIILIDDIYTTGATLEECAKVLKEAGAMEICGVVIAKD